MLSPRREPPTSRRLGIPDIDGAGVASQPALPALVPLWEEPAPVPQESVRLLADALSIPEPLCALLVQRGLTEPKDAKSYLRPLLSDLHPASLLAGSKQAVARILGAIDSDETVLVHGDYDVDGVSGAALLTRWIRRMGGDAVPFVPNRLRDGYDLGSAGLEAARTAGAGLIVTVDSGIRAHDAVAAANAAGIDVIVTDHHTPADTLPSALAVVDPNRADCEYPNKGLCGTGVAYRLCELMADERGIGHEELHGFLDLVALATIADVVPLDQENRTLVRYGLKALARTELPGLRALMKQAGMEDSLPEAGQVAFRLAPRINAAGRMAEAMTALESLMTEDSGQADDLAGRLEKNNSNRREEEARTLEQALETLRASYHPEDDFGVVLAGEGWHPGVIGIVASRIVERIHRPTVLVAVRDGQGRGSARSVSGFDLYGAVHACRKYLGRFGGHRAAAGMDIAPERIEDFRQAFNSEARDRFHGQPPRPTIRPHVELRLSQATERLAHFLTYFGPFGIGNPTPVFLARDVDLESPAREVGTGHLKLRLAQAGHSLDAIGFGLVHRIPPESLGTGPVDLTFKLKIGEFRGRRRVEAHLLDVRRSGTADSVSADTAT